MNATRIIAGCAALLIASLFGAQARAQGRAERILRAAAHCPAEVSARLRDGIEASDDTRVLAGHGGRIVLRTRTFGSGIDGVTEISWLELDPQTCALVEMNEAIYNNLLFEAQIHDGSGGAAPWQLVRRLESPVEAYSPELASHGLVGLLEAGHAGDLATACSFGARDEHGVAVSGPINAAQPWAPGRPRRAPAVYVERSGRLYRATQPPRRTQRVGDFDVYEVALPSRFRGVAVALYDRTAQRHRWVFASVGCAAGAIRWLGREGDWMFGITRSPHPEWSPVLFALSLARAEVRAIAGSELVNDAGLRRALAGCDVARARDDEDATCVDASIRSGELVTRRCSPECRAVSDSRADLVRALER